MSLNHVEPFHFATQLLTGKDLVQTLHLQSLQTSGNTCRKPSKDSKVRNSMFQHVSTCFNVWQSMLRFRVPLCSDGTHETSYEQNTMGKGPNLSPWGLVNERPRKKISRQEQWELAWRKVASQGGVELSGKELGGSWMKWIHIKVCMTNCGFGTWTAPHPLRKQGKKMN